MKRGTALLLLFLYSFQLFAQRYRGERSYDIVGLADGDDIMDALKIGIPLVIIGFLMAYYSTKKNNTEKKDGSVIGCIGMIAIIAGIIALFPLLSWLELIVVSVVSLFYVLAVIVAIIAVIIMLFQKLKK